MEVLAKEVGKIALESLEITPSKRDDRLLPVRMKDDDTMMSSVLQMACQQGIMVCSEPHERSGRDQMFLSTDLPEDGNHWPRL